MVSSEIRQAQRGISLAAVYAHEPVTGARRREAKKARARAAKKKGGGGGGGGARARMAVAGGARAAARPTTKARGKRAGGAKTRAADLVTGPFLAPGSLTARERRTLIAGIEKVLEGAFTHLPLKRARYGFDPVQRLRILRSQIDDLPEDSFHAELADIVTRLRDAHTRYVGPTALMGSVAVLPFQVEMAGSATTPQYVVTHVGEGLDADFKPGVIIEFWNGVRIDRAVQRYSEREVGGRPDTLRAWATQSLTMRALQFGPPPDEIWVEIDYRAPTGTGALKHTRVNWQIVNPEDVSPARGGLFASRREAGHRRAQAVNPAAEAVRRARVLLFAARAYEGDQAQAPAWSRTDGAKPGGAKGAAAQIIPTALTQTLKAMSIPDPGGAFGYLRIYAFNSPPDTFIDELVRLIPQLPDRGLILDLRGNPGGYIVSSERALQLFTPKPIQPTRFSVLATEFTRAMANGSGPMKAELAPWKASLEAAVRNGEQYAQAIPITDPAECNDLGQHYGGPVLLVGDATTYSAGDLFTAGFVDNAIGPFICVGSATGAGGANVWTYADLKSDLTGTDLALPTLPDGIDLSFSFRRATRSGPNEGIPIEDVGIAGTQYDMTYDDLMFDRRDLIAQCIAALKREPFTRMQAVVDATARTITVSTTGLDQLDVEIDGKREPSRSITDGTAAVVTYPASATEVELIGLAADTVRQRRRLPV